jgi:hypothetical protein
MKLYGAASCTSCGQARTLLGRTPLDWMYIDVATIQGFQGEIPMLELEDGTFRIGLGQIAQFIREMGFR